MLLEVKDHDLYFLQDNKLLDDVIMATEEYLRELNEVLPITKKESLSKLSIVLLET